MSDLCPDWMSQIDAGWTLFLDRDGVINRRKKPGYILSRDEFVLLPQVPEAIASLRQVFGQIVVVTNQQGIGKGLMTEADLAQIHAALQQAVGAAGGKIDHIYYAGELAPHPRRKPAPAMALQAQADFPSLDFRRSVMVGDTGSDLQFGRGLGMRTVWVENIWESASLAGEADYVCPDLWTFAEMLGKIQP